MVEKEEVIVAVLIMVMAGLLLILLLLPSKDVVKTLEDGLTTAKSFVPQQQTTTTAARRVATTSTSTTTSTTFWMPTTTSTLAKKAPSTTTVSTSSTSSLPGKRCASEGDCGGIVSELKCKGNSIWNFTTVYQCMNRGSPSSYCMGKPKNKVVLKCDIYEECRNGTCVRVYNNECHYLCDEAGYDTYYCTDDTCSGGDESMSLEEGKCSDYGNNCCCHNPSGNGTDYN
jgi:hypothetical protein